MIQSRIKTHKTKDMESIKNAYKENCERWMGIAEDYEEQWNLQQQKISDIKAIFNSNGYSIQDIHLRIEDL